MRSHLMSLIVAGVPVLFFAFAAPAEGGLPPGQEPADPEVATPSWDPRDFSGVWYNYSDRSSRTRGIGSRESMTPLTPEGIAKMDGRIPANAARVPSLANDPIYHCDPIGFPRVLLDRHESLEFIHTEDRLLQFFQWGRRLREIWLDGRELPSGGKPGQPGAGVVWTLGGRMGCRHPDRQHGGYRWPGVAGSSGASDQFRRTCRRTLATGRCGHFRASNDAL